MSDLQELTNELMQDEEFKKEYEALQPEMAHIMTGFMKSVKVSGRHFLSKKGSEKSFHKKLDRLINISYNEANNH